MAYYVNPPSVDEVTGQVIGEPTITHRDLNTRQLTISEPVDPSEFNDALEPHYAQKAVQANLPVFDPNATDEAIINFWNSKQPLTDAQISALQAAYVATDNDDIANLVQYRLSGDSSLLSEQQRYELGLQSGLDDDTEPMSDDSDTDDSDGGYAEQVSDYLFDNADEPNQEIAQQILNVETDGSDASTIIQHLSYKYYAGELSLDDCYDQALNSGIDPDVLAKAFTTFQSNFHK